MNQWWKKESKETYGLIDSLMVGLSSVRSYFNATYALTQHPHIAYGTKELLADLQHQTNEMPFDYWKENVRAIEQSDDWRWVEAKEDWRPVAGGRSITNRMVVCANELQPLAIILLNENNPDKTEIIYDIYEFLTYTNSSGSPLQNKLKNRLKAAKWSF